MKFDIIGMLAFFLGWQFVELVKAILDVSTMKEYLILGIIAGIIASFIFGLFMSILKSTWKKKK
jgi:xanthosine utilization system XapX-like protein